CMKFFRLIYLSICCILPLQAQIELHSLEDAYQLLSTNHSRLKLMQSQSSELNLDTKIQQSALLPAVRLNSNADYNLNLPVQLIPAEIFGGPAGTFQKVQFGHPWVMGAGIEVQWPVLQIEKWRDIQSAKIASAQGPLKEKLELEQLKSKVLQNYF